MRASAATALDYDPVYIEATASIERNAAVSIGGDLRFDYSYRNASSHGPAGARDASIGNLSATTAVLRLQADVTPEIHAKFKLNLNGDDFPADDEILAEAMLVMGCLGVRGMEAFAGLGRAPYGQDITIGMIQSYHHSANRAETAEGDVFIALHPDYGDSAGSIGASGGPGRALPPMRPGQFDRALTAGFAYQPDDRWRAELAFFTPRESEYRNRLTHRRNPTDLGLALRLWGRIAPSLTIQASAMWTRSSDMADPSKRVDLQPGARMEKNAYAVSAGFDWRPERWRVFGEYQRSWNWNFTDGYRSEAMQLGMTVNLADSWRLGAMGEMLTISNPTQDASRDRYRKLVFNIRHDFNPSTFILLEWGGEWLRRSRRDARDDKSRGSLVGMRLGFTF